MGREGWNEKLFWRAELSSEDTRVVREHGLSPLRDYPGTRVPSMVQGT